MKHSERSALRRAARRLLFSRCVFRPAAVSCLLCALLFGKIEGLRSSGFFRTMNAAFPLSEVLAADAAELLLLSALSAILQVILRRAVARAPHAADGQPAAPMLRHRFFARLRLRCTFLPAWILFFFAFAPDAAKAGWLRTALLTAAALLFLRAKAICVLSSAAEKQQDNSMIDRRQIS